jgi:hypothetical protein
LRLACTVGLRVFVCQNLAFHGDYSPVLATLEAFLARRRTVPPSGWTGCNGTLVRCGSRSKAGARSS